MQTEPIEILLVEDNPGDIELVRTGFQDARISNNLTVISDGQKALDYFETDQPIPDLVLLDINLPKVSGIDILQKIRNTDISAKIPVVMLTSSDAERDIAKSYSEHASCFITKPVDFDKFIGVIQSIENFWLTVVKLPSSK